MIRRCRVCGADLVVGENVTQCLIDHRDYRCRTCARDYDRDYRQDYRYRTGKTQPMSKNRACSLFLGVYVAERVLSRIFKNVIRMPAKNPGFDFVCNRGKKVDVKSACRRHHCQHQSDNWEFNINKNQIAEYFLCLAFDNRESLNPEHIWLIPAGKVDDHVTISISESRLDKWAEHEHLIDKVYECCNTLRGEYI